MTIPPSAPVNRFLSAHVDLANWYRDNPDAFFDLPVELQNIILDIGVAMMDMHAVVVEHLDEREEAT